MTIYNFGSSKNADITFNAANDKIFFDHQILISSIVLEQRNNDVVINSTVRLLNTQLSELTDFNFAFHNQNTYTLTTAGSTLILTQTAVGTLPATYEVFHGTDSWNSINAGLGDDVIYGNGGNDFLYGGFGNDILDGGTGKDNLAGGTGDDIYYVDDLEDDVIELANSGIDTVISTVDYTLGTYVENLVLMGNAINGTGNASDNIITGNSKNNVLSALAGNDTVYGGAGNDIIYGGDGNDLLYGGIGADTLYGGTGNDILDGGSAGDTMVGGAGDDIYYVDSIADVIIEAANEGYDLVYSKAGTTNLSDNVEDLVLLGTADSNASGNNGANVITGNDGNNTINALGGNDTVYGGIGNDRLYGGAGDDALYGGAGNDILDGGTGTDTLYGGAGDDTYYVDSVNDVVVEAANQGYDIIVSTADNYTLSSYVEELKLAGSGNISATGNSLNNILTGNAGNNALYGADGDDTIYGASGKDSLYGGAGNDQLYGGTGIDILYGGAGNDILDGGSAGDTLIGGAGDDIYYVDSIADVVIEAENEGTDLVISSAQSHNLAEYVENLTLIGSLNSTGVGNGLNNILIGNDANNILSGNSGIDILYGGLGNDKLYGGTDNDTLYGGEGDDLLDGGTGADTMYGGKGDDTYYVDTLNDVVVELANQGTDTVISTISNYTLNDFVENLTLGGLANINGQGNSLANVITGNQGNNILSGNSGTDTLYGGAGNDTLYGGSGVDTLYGGDGNDILDGGTAGDALYGGKGNDIYYVDSIADTVIELINEGHDTVYSSALRHTLSSNVEDLILTGTADIDGTGNGLANLLQGNEGVNTLRAEAGNDVLQGMGGNDQLYGGTGSDTALYTVLADADALGGNGTDQWFDFTLGNTATNAEADVINIADLLTGYTSGTSNLADFVQVSVSANGKDTIIQLDRDGAEQNFTGYSDLLVLKNVNTTLQDLVDNHQIIA